MLRQNFKKILIVLLISIFASFSLLYFLYETGRILNFGNFNNRNIKEVNLNYMNKSIDGYEGEIDEKEFGERFISWSLLNLYNEDLFNKNIEFDFKFSDDQVYAQIKINQDVYQIYEFIEHEN